MLRPVRDSDEQVVVRAHTVMRSDGFEFAGGYRDGMPFADYVSMLDEQRHARDVTPARVPATFLLASIGSHSRKPE